VTRRYQGLRWHDLRHTFGSWHAQNGTPPQVIKALGGWASMQMVERYMHLAPSFTASFANNIQGKKDQP
jgi:integrase